MPDGAGPDRSHGSGSSAPGRAGSGEPGRNWWAEPLHVGEDRPQHATSVEDDREPAPEPVGPDAPGPRAEAVGAWLDTSVGTEGPAVLGDGGDAAGGDAEQPEDGPAPTPADEVAAGAWLSSYLQATIPGAAREDERRSEPTKSLPEPREPIPSPDDQAPLEESGPPVSALLSFIDHLTHDPAPMDAVDGPSVDGEPSDETDTAAAEAEDVDLGMPVHDSVEAADSLGREGDAAPAWPWDVDAQQDSDGTGSTDGDALPVGDPGVEARAHPDVVGSSDGEPPLSPQPTEHPEPPDHDDVPRDSTPAADPGVVASEGASSEPAEALTQGESTLESVSAWVSEDASGAVWEPAEPADEAVGQPESETAAVGSGHVGMDPAQEGGPRTETAENPQPVSDEWVGPEAEEPSAQEPGPVENAEAVADGWVPAEVAVASHGDAPDVQELEPGSDQALADERSTRPEAGLGEVRPDAEDESSLTGQRPDDEVGTAPGADIGVDAVAAAGEPAPEPARRSERVRSLGEAAGSAPEVEGEQRTGPAEQEPVPGSGAGSQPPPVDETVATTDALPANPDATAEPEQATEPASGSDAERPDDRVASATADLGVAAAVEPAEAPGTPAEAQLGLVDVGVERWPTGAPLPETGSGSDAPTADEVNPTSEGDLERVGAVAEEGEVRVVEGGPVPEGDLERVGAVPEEEEVRVVEGGPVPEADPEHVGEVPVSGDVRTDVAPARDESTPGHPVLAAGAALAYRALSEPEEAGVSARTDDTFLDVVADHAPGAEVGTELAEPHGAPAEEAPAPVDVAGTRADVAGASVEAAGAAEEAVGTGEPAGAAAESDDAPVPRATSHPVTVTWRGSDYMEYLEMDQPDLLHTEDLIIVEPPTQLMAPSRRRRPPPRVPDPAEDHDDDLEPTARGTSTTPATPQMPQSVQVPRTPAAEPTRVEKEARTPSGRGGRWTLVLAVVLVIVLALAWFFLIRDNGSSSANSGRSLDGTAQVVHHGASVTPAPLEF